MNKIVSVAAVAALVLAACGGSAGSQTAAVVGDEEITVSEVRDVPFETEGTMEPTQFAQYLGALIQWNIIEHAAEEEFGIAPTEEQVQAELDEIISTLAPDMTVEELAEQEGLSVSTLERFARTSYIQDAVSDELGGDAEGPTEEEIAQARDEAAANQTEVCVRHILVDSEEAALDAKERIEGGEDFSAVAEEVSTDPSAAENGGDLGCAPAGQYVPTFRDAAIAAEIDEITEPIETQFGVHILQVYERTEPTEESLPTDEDLRTQLIEASQGEALQSWLLEKASSAEVTVEEEYGSWTTSPQPQVVPPSG